MSTATARKVVYTHVVPVRVPVRTRAAGVRLVVQHTSHPPPLAPGGATSVAEPSAFNVTSNTGCAAPAGTFFPTADIHVGPLLYVIVEPSSTAPCVLHLKLPRSSTSGVKDWPKWRHAFGATCG